MLIEQAGHLKGRLGEKVAIVTGAGGGIGLEAARALAWLGAHVVIAELDPQKGESAAQQIQQEFGPKAALSIPTDVASDAQIRRLVRRTVSRFGRVDILIHNAAMVALGNVDELPMEEWDFSYAVNFRGVLMLTRAVLPHMKQQRSGVIAFVPSSGAAPYMGAYEVFKTAQVELMNTLAAELAGQDASNPTNVYTYAIGPGLVKTQTAAQAIERIAEVYGMSTQAFYEQNGAMMLSAEAAGVGFAVSTLQAEKYHGTEIGSIQALRDAGIDPDQTEGSASATQIKLTPKQQGALLEHLEPILQTLQQQAQGWHARVVFERQWVLRDFKKTTGMSPEIMLENLLAMQTKLQAGEYDVGTAASVILPLRRYWLRQNELLMGFEKNVVKRNESAAIIQSWVEQIDGYLAQAAGLAERGENACRD